MDIRQAARPPGRLLVNDFFDSALDRRLEEPEGKRYVVQNGNLSLVDCPKKSAFQRLLSWFCDGTPDDWKRHNENRTAILSFAKALRDEQPFTDRHTRSLIQERLQNLCDSGKALTPKVVRQIYGKTSGFRNPVSARQLHAVCADASQTDRKMRLNWDPDRANRLILQSDDGSSPDHPQKMINCQIIQGVMKDIHESNLPRGVVEHLTERLTAKFRVGAYLTSDDLVYIQRFQEFANAGRPEDHDRLNDWLAIRAGQGKGLALSYNANGELQIVRRPIAQCTDQAGNRQSVQILLSNYIGHLPEGEVRDKWASKLNQLYDKGQTLTDGDLMKLHRASTVGPQVALRKHQIPIERVATQPYRDRKKLGNGGLNTVHTVKNADGDTKVVKDIKVKNPSTAKCRVPLAVQYGVHPDGNKTHLRAEGVQAVARSSEIVRSVTVRSELALVSNSETEPYAATVMDLALENKRTFKTLDLSFPETSRLMSQYEQNYNALVQQRGINQKDMDGCHQASQDAIQIVKNDYAKRTGMTLLSIGNWNSRARVLRRVSGPEKFEKAIRGLPEEQRKQRIGQAYYKALEAHFANNILADPDCHDGNGNWKIPEARSSKEGVIHKKFDPDAALALLTLNEILNPKEHFADASDFIRKMQARGAVDESSLNALAENLDMFNPSYKGNLKPNRPPNSPNPDDYWPNRDYLAGRLALGDQTISPLFRRFPKVIPQSMYDRLNADCQRMQELGKHDGDWALNALHPRQADYVRSRAEDIRALCVFDPADLYTQNQNSGLPLISQGGANISQATSASENDDQVQGRGANNDDWQLNPNAFFARIEEDTDSDIESQSKSDPNAAKAGMGSPDSVVSGANGAVSQPNVAPNQPNNPQSRPFWQHDAQAFWQEMNDIASNNDPNQAPLPTPMVVKDKDKILVVPDDQWNSMCQRAFDFNMQRNRGEPPQFNLDQYEQSLNNDWNGFLRS